MAESSHMQGANPYAAPTTDGEPPQADFELLPDGKVRLRLGVPVPRMCFRCGVLAPRAWIGPRLRPQAIRKLPDGYPLPHCHYCFFGALLSWLGACVALFLSAALLLGPVLLEIRRLRLFGDNGIQALTAVSVSVVPGLLVMMRAIRGMLAGVKTIEGDVITVVGMRPAAIKTLAEFVRRSRPSR